MTQRTSSPKALTEQLVTKEQLREASRRQRIHGGRLGENLIALGYITEDQLDSVFKRTPPAPQTVASYNFV